MARPKVLVFQHVPFEPLGTLDPVLAAFALTQEVFQWHEDGITLPPGADLLASSAASPVQAFRYGEHAYGFQFHLEANRPLIDRWLTVPAHQETLQEEQDSVDTDGMRHQADTSVALLESLSRGVFSMDRQVRDRSS